MSRRLRLVPGFGVVALLTALLVVAGPARAGAAQGSDLPPACRRDANACVTVGVGEPIYLGTLLDRTQLSGQDSTTAIALAVDHLDGSFDGTDGQLLGHRVVLLDQEDGCSAAVAAVNEQQLLGDQRVVAVIGTTCSSAALGTAARAFSAERIPLVSPSNTAPALTDPKIHERYYFRTAWNDKIQAAVDANFADSRHWNQIAVVSDPTDAYSAQVTQAFIDATRRNQGRGVVVDASKGADVQAIVDQVAASRPKMIFVTALSPFCIDVARALRSATATARVPMLMSDACADKNFLDQLGPLSDGVYSSGPDFSFYDDNAFYRTNFLDAYRRRTGIEPPTVFHAQAYDAAEIVFGAIRKAAIRRPSGELVIQRRSLRNALLRTSQYPGLSGILTCTENGDCAQNVRIAIYRAPGWPTDSQANATKVFSQSLSLSQLNASD